MFLVKISYVLFKRLNLQNAGNCHVTFTVSIKAVTDVL